MSKGIDSKGGEGRKNYKNSGPSLVKGEGEVNEDLVSDVGGGVVFLDDVIDVCDGDGYEDRKNES